MYRFDLPVFYKEVRRVLRPNGAFAAWGYDLCEFKNAAANAALYALYEGTLGPYWSERRRLIERQYEGNWQCILSIYCTRVFLIEYSKTRPVITHCLLGRHMTSAGMEPGSEHFGEVKRVMIDTMTTEMTVSALVTLWRLHCFSRILSTPKQVVLL